MPSSSTRAPAPASISLPPSGFESSSALDTPDSTPGTSPLPDRRQPQQQRAGSSAAPGPHRISFSQTALTGRRGHRPSGASSKRFSTAGGRRMSAASRARSLIDGGEGELTEEELKPVVPSLFHTGLIRKEPDATPLPLLPMLVLGIAMMGEFLSANVSAPFLLAMVRSFGTDPVGVGTSAGYIVSAFFLTQFFTSLLWASLADQYGRRAVLFTTLVGSGLTVIVFGTSRSLPEAIAVRLAQGVFSGGIGVVRSGIKDVTDSTNEAKAYALLGFVWGFGGVIGPVIGGLAESPARNYPDSYVGQLPLFRSYPYLFPCLLASAILFTGAILSLFLNRDGGSRFGGIALPIEKDDTSAEGPTTSGPLESAVSPAPETDSGPAAVPKQLAKRLSGYFAQRVMGVQGSSTRASFAAGATSVPLAEATPKRRTVSSAYGYNAGRSTSGRYRPSFSSDATVRMERGEGDDEPVQEEHLGTGLLGTLTERLLLANEAASGNTLGDLWLSQALAQDQESVFESEDGEDEEDDEIRNLDDLSDEDAMTSAPISATASPSASRLGPRDAMRSPSQGPSPLSPNTRRHVSRSQLGVEPSGHFPGGHRMSTLGNYSSRRVSTASVRPPSLFAHTGLQSPHQTMASPSAGGGRPGEEQDPFAATIAAEGLAPITEGAPARFGGAGSDAAALAPLAAKEPSVLWKLPLFLIFQYFALALHDTINGQLFLSILNSEYEVGGLGLSPSHFSTLIAVMCGFQVAYQFIAYPKLGPPLGPLSHIQMFRLGSALYIPAYLSTPVLRAFASAGNDGSPILMAALTLNMACRYAGGTFCYTSIMILTNAMSPPEVVNLANGLAQSTVSAARVLGPLAGGVLWSVSEAKGNTALGFEIVAMACAVALCSSFLLR